MPSPKTGQSADSPTEVPVPQPAPDPFDLNALRELPRDDDIKVRKILLSIPVRKPGKQEFFRVNPDPEFTIDAPIYEHENGLNRDLYWIHPDLRPDLRPELRWVRLFYCKSRRGVDFLWPAKLPLADGSGSGRAWSESALEIADAAMKSWVRMAGNTDSGRYELFEAQGDLGEPAWLDKSLRELIELAFKGRVIDHQDHPVLQDLYGRV
jgi:hypothetical protein